MSTAIRDYDQLSPGVTVEVRDEFWLVTSVSRVTDGFRVRVRGLSDYVRDTTSTFFTALDEVRVFDPAQVTTVADNSTGFRHSRLWLESTLRQTPVPLHQEDLEVATRMLADPLDYQLEAVRKALSPERIRPRVLIADAVGLGKTLEMGMIMAELIRRGRGDRILVVTPKHVLEQFQQEMWTRFAIPLVRLDSQGIQQVRQKLPSSKNPFTYFPRVIVSMDTLKSAKYRAQLEKVSWDIVVMDEIHNATNRGTQNNQLARTLAPRTEALILASATPHNGDPESFREILRLLDPLAVSPSGEIDAAVAKDLIIRRHRNSPEVAEVVGAKWAERLEPRNIIVDASEEEDAVANELRDTWVQASQHNLFTWVLVKAFLSSPAALESTITQRLKTTDSAQEKEALERLQKLNNQVTPENSNKYAQLVTYLQDEVGISKTSDTRVVIFSERVQTLTWLQKNLTKHLKMPAGSVKVMHGGMSDIEQMAVIDEFKRTNTPLRVLITGDVASEGVNLHAQCHHLVHYDIPWSLIRIQQRNGRIDRYGQTQSPQITTFLLDPEDPEAVGEVRVLAKLMEREHSAHEMLGDASSLMGEYSTSGEEDKIRDVLRKRRDFEVTVRTPEELIDAARNHTPEPEEDPGDESDHDDWLATLAAIIDAEDDPAESSAQKPTETSLYVEEKDYLVDALLQAFNEVPAQSPARGGVDLVLHDNDLLELTPREDLQRRFDYLPQDYVEYRQVKERLMLATSITRGEQQLKRAREGDSEKSWPKAHFLGPLHPVTEWAADRALSSMKRSEIPAFEGAVDQMTALLMATLTNSRGQVLTRAFMTAVPGPFGLNTPGISGAQVTTIPDAIRWLKHVGLRKGAISSGELEVPQDADALVREAVAAAESALALIKDGAVANARQRIDRWRRRADAWESETVGRRASASLKHSQRVLAEEEELLKASIPERTLIRPLAVVLPNSLGEQE